MSVEDEFLLFDSSDDVDISIGNDDCLGIVG
jgi:hypothetical protein